MSNPKKRRKILVFTAIGVVLVGLTAWSLFKKREVVVTIQTEKVARRNLTEIVSASGKIQPVLQVKISPEVSGEIIALPFKEGQSVHKGEMILKIKPDFYIANRNQADAAYKGSLAAKEVAEANRRKAEAEFKRVQGLFQSKLVSDSAFDEAKAAFDVAQAQLVNAEHQVEMTRASLASAEEELAKTTVVSPLTGTISKLNSQLGERVLGMVQNVGTDVMTIADLNEMEARVDIGEMDVVLIKPGQKVRLEVDAFKDQAFTGTVTEIANSAKGSGVGGLAASSSSSQEATKFEVKIRIKDKEAFRPGMSVTAEIETRNRTNVLTVPIASVTTRLPKAKEEKCEPSAVGSNAPSAGKSFGTKANAAEALTNPAVVASTNAAGAKSKDALKPIEVVFVLDGARAKMVPVKLGISDDNHWEITEGLQDNQEVVSGGFRAITRDLEDGKKVQKGKLETTSEQAK